MAVNDEFIYSLRNANPIEDVMRSYVTLKRSGSRNFVCSCPFHSEKSPSCTVFVDTQSFYCFGCQAGGDVIGFIMKIENLTFMEAVKFLAARAGMEVPESGSRTDQFSHRRTRIYEMNRLAANHFYRNLVSGSDKSGLEYLISRRLRPETIKKYGLGYSSDSWNDLTDYLRSEGYGDDEIIDAWLAGRGRNGNLYDMFRKRVMFPIVDMRGNIIGFGGRVLDDSKPKYLNTGKTPVFDKGQNLFSMNFAKDSDTKRLILCEGYMDVIAVNQAGFSNAVATLGTAITSDQARLISHYANEVIIAYDSDGAGQNATQKALNQFSEVGLQARILRMEGAKDPDEYIKKFGADRFRMLLDESGNAMNFILDNCEKGLDLSDEADRVEFLRRAAKALAAIDSKLEREVYISRTCKKCDIPPEVLKSHVDDIISRGRRSAVKKEWRNIKAYASYKHDEINPEAVKFRKESKAEESIIYYLLHRVQEADRIAEEAPPDIFVTSFNKRVYAAILDKMQNSVKFSLSLLNEEFSEEEMGRISGIEARHRETGLSSAGFADCVNVLKSHRSGGNGEAPTVNDLEDLFKSKKRSR